MTLRDHSPFFNSRVDLPETWITKAHTLLRSAQAVWVEFARCEQIQKEIYIALAKSAGPAEPGPRTIEDPSAVDALQGLATLEVYLMLMGMAIENLLKAKLLASDKESYVERLIQNIRLKGLFRRHELEHLAARAGMYEALTDDQKTLLKVMTIHVVWKGRYPIPTEAKKLNSFEWGAQSDAAFGFPIYLGIKDECEALYLRAASASPRVKQGVL